MNIYFACSITGGRDDEIFYRIIVNALQAEGHYVPTEHLATPEVMSLEETVDPIEVYTRDMEWIESSHALVAEVSTPSHGVGYEISSALAKGKPVLCLHRVDSRVSKMITGNTHPRLVVRSYQLEEDIPQLIKDFLLQISQ